MGKGYFFLFVRFPFFLTKLKPFFRRDNPVRAGVPLLAAWSDPQGGETEEEGRDGEEEAQPHDDAKRDAENAYEAEGKAACVQRSQPAAQIQPEHNGKKIMLKLFIFYFA